MTPTGQVVRSFIRILEALRVPYMIGGSFASSAWGMPRQTHDLDIAIILSQENAESLFEAAKDEFMVSKSDIDEALGSYAEFRGFQLIHFEETFKIDVFILNSTEYVLGSFERTLNYPILEDLSVPYACPEDVIITKLRWYLLGNKVSDKQWNDIVQVLEVQYGKLDELYMAKWAAHFGVLDLLREAQSQVIV